MRKRYLKLYNFDRDQNIHVYGKREVKKGRKMGHVTELFDKDRTF